MIANPALPPWREGEVTSPGLGRPVPVIAAIDVPYVAGGNRLQTVNLYLPVTPQNSALVGSPLAALPAPNAVSSLPRYYVHVHGGAWRDPQLLARSIEPAVAHLFADGAAPVAAVASISYTLTHFPTHPTLPYDAATAKHADPAREALHPRHVGDVLKAFALLRSLGLADRSYILSGHSCGACLAFQSILKAPREHGVPDVEDAPCPAAIFGLNGLYDLPALVDGLGPTHEHLREVYETLLSNAFGADPARWSAPSPALFDPHDVGVRLRRGRAPPLVVLDQSTEDQLVPMNQMVRLATTLERVEGLRVVQGRRCTGKHAAPWEGGVMIADSLRDVLAMLGTNGDPKPVA